MVTEIAEDPSDFEMVYDPQHPDADENGYVAMPNVDLIKETTDAMAATHAYTANKTDGTKSPGNREVIQTAKSIGKRVRIWNKLN